MTPECSFSFQRASHRDCPPSPSCPWELKGKVTSSYSHRCQLTNWWIESHKHPVHLPSTASTFSNLAWSGPPSASSNLQYYSLAVHLYIHLIMASMCTSKLNWLWPPSLHHHGVQVHLPTHLIMASKWISKLTPSLPPSQHDHGVHVNLKTYAISPLECIIKFSGSPPQSVSPNSPNNTFRVRMVMASHVHLQTLLMLASKFTQSWPPSASPTLHDHCLQVHLWIHSIVIFRLT